MVRSLILCTVTLPLAVLATAVLTASASLLLMAGRAPDAYAAGAAAGRVVAETGVHLASLWPREAFSAPDPDPADPELAEAARAGAGWTREEAAERILAALDEVAGDPQDVA